MWNDTRGGDRSDSKRKMLSFNSNTALVICFVLCFSIISEGQLLRIKNGEDVEPGQRPFQVSLQYHKNSEHFCGGSILTEEHVITAAHCTQNGSIDHQPEEIQAAVGISLNKPTSIHRVTEIIRHEKYNFSDFIVNDIALLKVTPPFKLDKTIYPVRLPLLNLDLPAGQKAVVSGWGSTSFPIPTWPTAMKQVTVTIVDQTYCQKMYEKIGYTIYPEQLCTHEKSEEGIGHCVGDSGGPLTINDTTLVGIVSWSKKDPTCGSHLYPSVYTRVSEYVYWLYENVNRNRKV